MKNVKLVEKKQMYFWQMLLVDRRCHRIFQIDAFYCKCRVSILNFLKIIEKCCEKLLYIQRRFNSAYIYIYIFKKFFSRKILFFSSQRTFFFFCSSLQNTLFSRSSSSPYKLLSASFTNSIFTSCFEQS